MTSPAPDPVPEPRRGGRRPGTKIDPALARKRIGDVLCEAGLISEPQLQQALGAQRQADGTRRRLGQVVVDLGMASEKQVARCLADLLSLEMVDLSLRVPAPDVVRLLPRAVAERTNVLVLDRTPQGLVVATSDPTNVLALDDVRLYTRSVELDVLVATDSQIRDHLNRAWSLGQDDAGVSAMVEEIGADAAPEREVVTAGGDLDGAPIVKFVNQVFADAVRLRASDIHIETQRDALRVRYRIDGLLRDMMNAPHRIAGAVISRIKIVSGLDIAERRVPQDGRCRIVVEGAAIDLRVSSLPALHGEKIVIRLLTRGDDVPGLARLGFETDQLEIFRLGLARPQGLILITGPTGSGKTNTLYAAINEINSPELNIVTLEDPVEVQLSGITQVGVNAKVGMTFAAGLRSVLRQDPDIVLVGEARDPETAELALKAAMTGHLVLTTLHTNSAVAALTRLVDMGVEPFMVASSLTCAIAQRLVRTPCQSCVAPYEPDEVLLTGLGLSRADLAGGSPMRGVGCTDCGDTGYKGRTAVYEVLSVDEGLRQTFMNDPTEAAVTAAAKAAGMATLRASAIRKAMDGRTTFEEAVRVTAGDQVSVHECQSCQRPVEPDMIACPWCGTRLDHSRCHGCERKLDPQWSTCPWCLTATGHGMPLAAPAVHPAQAPVVPVQAVPVQAVPVQAAPAPVEPAVPVAVPVPAPVAVPAPVVESSPWVESFEASPRRAARHAPQAAEPLAAPWLDEAPLSSPWLSPDPQA